MAIATTLLQIAGSLVLIFLGIVLAPGDEDFPAAASPRSEPSRGPRPSGDPPSHSDPATLRAAQSRRSRDRTEELTARCYAATES